MAKRSSNPLNEPAIQLLTEIKSSLARIDERMQSMEETAKETHQTVHGYNGNPGLVSDVRSLTEDVSALKEAHALSVANGDDAVWSCKPVQQLAKEHNELKKRVEEYPTYAWLP